MWVWKEFAEDSMMSNWSLLTTTNILLEGNNNSFFLFFTFFTILDKGFSKLLFVIFYHELSCINLDCISKGSAVLESLMIANSRYFSVL